MIKYTKKSVCSLLIVFLVLCKVTPLFACDNQSICNSNSIFWNNITLSLRDSIKEYKVISIEIIPKQSIVDYLTYKGTRKLSKEQKRSLKKMKTIYKIKLAVSEYSSRSIVSIERKGEKKKGKKIAIGETYKFELIPHFDEKAISTPVILLAVTIDGITIPIRGPGVYTAYTSPNLEGLYYISPDK